MRNDENKIKDIKSTLISFQDNYNERNFDNIENIIKEFFINEKDTSFVGAGINSWHFGLEEIAAAITSYWEDENKYLENIELDINKSVINVENSVATITVPGKSVRNIKEEHTYQAIVDTLSEKLNEKEISKSDLIKLSTKIVTTLNDIKIGEGYIWPFRVSIVMISDGLKWMIKHMNLSFCCGDNMVLLNNESIDDKFKIIPIDKKDSLEIREVQEVLKTLQEAYDKRDVSLVDSYGDELLDSNEFLSIIGTDQGEVFHGFNEGKELFKSDWKYWGDFNLNRENSYISILDNVAVVCSKALIKFTWEENDVCSWVKGDFEWYLKKKKTNKQLLNIMLLSINSSLQILETSDKKTTAPMKFFGVLVKRDGRWKFNHMHFSDTIDVTPSRIVGV